MKLFILLETLFNTIFQMGNKIKKGKHIKSRDICFQPDLQSAFTYIFSKTCKRRDLPQWSGSVDTLIHMHF